MRHKVCLLDPFLSSISYLSKESERLKLRKVHEILQETTERLSNHIIEELMSSENKYKREDLEPDYGIMREFLIAISSLTPDQISELSEFMDNELINENYETDIVK